MTERKAPYRAVAGRTGRKRRSGVKRPERALRPARGACGCRAMPGPPRRVVVKIIGGVKFTARVRRRAAAQSGTTDALSREGPVVKAWREAARDAAKAAASPQPGSHPIVGGDLPHPSGGTPTRTTTAAG